MRHLGEGVPYGVPVRRWARTLCPKLSCTSEKDFHIEGLLSFEHEVDGSPEFMGEDRECFALSVLADQAVVIELSLFITSEEEASGLGKSPFEMGVADFTVLAAGLFASRFSWAFDEAAIGGEVLDPWKAVDIVDLVEEHEA